MSTAISDPRPCEHSMFGGVHTSGDPDGTRRKLGLVTFEYRHFCWDCWDKYGADWDKAVRADTKREIKNRNLCGFDKAWIGHCLNPKPCAEHDSVRCWKCSAPATYQCDIAVSLVCGAPCCDEHPHEAAHRAGSCVSK